MELNVGKEIAALKRSTPADRRPSGPPLGLLATRRSEGS